MNETEQQFVTDQDSLSVERRLIILRAYDKGREALLAKLMKKNGDKILPTRKTFNEFYKFPNQEIREMKMDKIEDSLFCAYIGNPSKEDAKKIEVYLDTLFKYWDLNVRLTMHNTVSACCAFLDQLITNGPIQSKDCHYNVREVYNSAVRVDMQTGEITATPRTKALYKYGKEKGLILGCN